ncbi:lysozyme family protein [Nitrogeniibacter aestuarii]|uniref:hypothetical protein n=1 Tax=Nitrogeniibacter aestuarii TaxID=2815343 RepID=UPI001E528BAB|nr:hypothetical protein [Nitrogeniibacter aestuarii]
MKSTDGLLLPYPWTLNVEQKPERFPTYRQAVKRLEYLVGSGVQNIDCGAVQVNWRWHKQRLGTPVQALHPYHNIRAGADYLRECFQTTGDWFKGTGRYHSPADPNRAEKYAQQVFSRMSGIRRA